MITCYFCGATVADSQAAADQDWVPSFYDPLGNEVLIRNPGQGVCPDCAAQHLHVDANGELEINPGSVHLLPPVGP